jgi:hypothetical protein
MECARSRWFLIVNADHLPEAQRAKGQANIPLDHCGWAGDLVQRGNWRPAHGELSGDPRWTRIRPE